MQLKESLRQKILEDRKNFNESEHFLANDVIVKSTQDVLNSFVALNNNKKLLGVGLYWQMLGEPDLLKSAVNSSWKTSIPKVNGVKMDFAPYEIGDTLEPSEFGNLVQPTANERVLPNIVIVPALAFSIEGHRLGFGKGHYDQYFAKNENIVKIGVCFHENLYEYLPNESHDIKMDYIITDQTTIAL